MRKNSKFPAIVIIVAIFSIIMVFIHNFKLDMKYSTAKQLSAMYSDNQESF